MSASKAIFLLLLPLTGLAQTDHRIQIQVGGGPEDMVLDTFGNERILISCAERRDENEYSSGIWEYDLNKEEARKLELVFKVDRHFSPHGISITHSGNQGYLFVINHISKKESEIIKFRITADTLYEEANFVNKLIKSPNDVYAVGEREFYFSNDNILGGSIGRFNDGEYSLISKGYSYANGIHVIADAVYVSTTMGNKIYKLIPGETGAQYKKEKLFNVKGGDNFTLTLRKTLLVTSHPSIMKFLKHANKVDKKSPSKVVELNLQNLSSTVVYFDKTGKEISACSTALEYKGYLYLAQVFDPYLLRIRLGEQSITP